MISDQTPPQEQAALFYLERKGMRSVAELRDVTKLDGRDCWYFVYDLRDTYDQVCWTIELEVEWTGSEWATMITTFRDLREQEASHA